MRTGTISNLPHIRASESVSKMMWKTVLALTPAVLSALFIFRARALVLISLSCLSTALAETAGRVVFKKRRKLGRATVVVDESAVLTGLIFSLLLPPSTPAWMAAAGGFIAIFLGREIEGGLGANRFNPALVGLAFLHFGFPEVISRSPAMVETLPVLLPAAGGLFLILQKMIRWEIPALFLLIQFLSSALAIGNFTPAVCDDCFAAVPSGAAALFAFFIITDPVTTPLTREGCRIFAVICAVLATILSRWFPPSGAMVFSVLLMNGAVPWIDRRIRPSRAYRKKG